MLFRSYRSARYASPALPLLAPLLLGLGNGPGALEGWRAVVTTWALLFQSLAVIPPPTLDALRFGDSRVLHLGGNTRQGVAEALSLLRRPPVALRTQGDIPFEGFAVDEMVDQIDGQGPGTVALLVPGGAPELRMPFGAELLRRGRSDESFRLVVVPPGTGDPALGQELDENHVFFAEVLDADDGRVANDRAAAMTGWTRLWERTVQRRTRRVERLWMRR